MIVAKMLLWLVLTVVGLWIATREYKWMDSANASLHRGDTSALSGLMAWGFVCVFLVFIAPLLVVALL